MAAALPAQKNVSKVTISPGMVESHIRTKLNALADQSFVPETMIDDVAQLRRDYEKLRVSYDLSRAIGLELDIDALLRKVLERAFDLLRADRGVILMYDDEHALQPRCVRTRKRGVATDEEVVLSTTILSAVEREKAAVLSNDASMDARFDQAKSIIMQGIRSTMAVPLLHGEELLGVMVLDSQVAANAFQEKDLQLFQNVANQAAVAIQNSLYARKIEAEALTREATPLPAYQLVNGQTGPNAACLQAARQAELPCQRCGTPMSPVVLGGRGTTDCRTWSRSWTSTEAYAAVTPSTADLRSVAPTPSAPVR